MTAHVDTPPEDAAALVTTLAGAEVRVHGIGQHDDLSALGKPQIERCTDRVDVASPPSIPAHSLKLVNWSRTSRGMSRGLLWYLAFPFTLINAVGNMGPGNGRRTLPRANAVVSVLLTVAAATWLVVIAETVLKVVPLPVDDERAGRAIAGALPILLAVGVFARWRRRRDTLKGSLASVHVVTLVLFGAAAAVLLPAQLAYSGWPSVVTPVRGPTPQFVDRLDPTAVLVIATTAFSVVASTWVMLARLRVPKADPAARTSLAMASILLIAAMTLMHTISSLLRMAVGWVADWASPANPRNPRLLAFDDRALMPYFSESTSSAPRLDLIPLYGLAVLLSLLLAAWLVIRLRESGPGKLVTRLPDLLGSICLGAGLLMIVSVAVLTWRLPDLMTGGTAFLVVRLIHVLTAVTALVVLLGAIPRVRTTMSLVADLAGFWEIEHHPLAGLSYRASTLAGITRTVVDAGARPVVLVGHSQGSVLCAWWAAHQPAAKVHLVTCGSPLSSLYAQFFPRHVNQDFFDKATENTRSWRNFWRDTDPIATALPISDNEKLTDPRPGKAVQGHGNYWTDPCQMDWVQGRVTAAPIDIR